MGIRSGGILVFSAAMLASAFPAHAQTAIGQGLPGPVVKQQGLLGTYYNYTGAAPPGAAPGSPVTPNTTTATQVFQRIDAPLDTNALTGPGLNADFFIIVWEGFIRTTVAGDYSFHLVTDDGQRFWFDDVTKAAPDSDVWGNSGETEDPAVNKTGLTAATRYATRLEYFENTGNVAVRLRWTPPGGTKVAIPAANLEPPDGPNAPTVTLNPNTNSPTPRITVNWTPAGTGVTAQSWIVSRGATSGGPMTQVFVGTATAFDDTTLPGFGTYYYRVQGTAGNGLLIGTPSAEQSTTSVQPQVTVSPTTGLVTTETGGSTVVNVTFNVAAPAGTTLVVSSDDATEGFVSGGGQGPAATINIPVTTGFTGAIPITITGQDDFVADGPINYNINVTVATFGGLVVPPTPVSNTDNDTPGISIVPASLSITENGGPQNFLIVLNSQPTGDVVIELASSDPAQVTVTPQVTLNGTNWNTGALVTLNPINDTVIELNVPYTIVTTLNAGATADPLYDVIDPADIGVLILDDEAIPDADDAWGCGALGLEAFVVLGLLALRRRRT